MTSEHDIDSSARRDLILFKSSCSLHALATIFAAVNADEINLDNEEWYGISEILKAVAEDLRKLRDEDQKKQLETS